MTMPIRFDNSYARLPERFHTRMSATPVPAPRLFALNSKLAEVLGLDLDWLRSPDGLAMLAGNAVPGGAAPLAQVYAGHQFGGYSPRLGDGRALLLGEVIGTDGQRRDIQLKGSGPTPYSRGGDGRAWLGPVIREYLVSEAMAALGIPTTRALAAVTTGAQVLREAGALPGAVLTRVAASHIRVGTFQYFAAQGDAEALRLLTDHVVKRHYPQAGDAAGLLGAVCAAQARLVAQWMAVGFIHGVMNTDNMTISGETIDYGPCAFMDRYDPVKVFSSIDRLGRYAYNKQPDMALWNLAQFASALLPLLAEDQQRATDIAYELLDGFAPLFQQEMARAFRRKLGLTGEEPGDVDLVQGLLSRMAAGRADFTRCFAGLAAGTARSAFEDPTAFDQWLPDWQARRARDAAPEAQQLALMQSANPQVIPRNHIVEQAIAAAVAGDFAPFDAALAAFTAPFDPPADPAFTEAPTAEQEVRQTFCGT